MFITQSCEQPVNVSTETEVFVLCKELCQVCFGGFEKQTFLNLVTTNANAILAILIPIVLLLLLTNPSP